MKTKIILFIALFLSGSMFAQVLVTNLNVKGAKQIGEIVTKPWGSNNKESAIGKASVLIQSNSVDIKNASVNITYAKGIIGPEVVTNDFINPVRIEATNRSGSKRMNVDVCVVNLTPIPYLPLLVSTLDGWNNTTAVGYAPMGVEPHPSNKSAMFVSEGASLYFAYEGQCSQLIAKAFMRSDEGWYSGDVFDFEWSTDGQVWHVVKRYDKSSPLYCANVPSLRKEHGNNGDISVPIDKSAKYVRARLTSSKSGKWIFLRDVKLMK